LLLLLLLEKQQLLLLLLRGGIERLGWLRRWRLRRRWRLLWDLQEVGHLRVGLLEQVGDLLARSPSRWLLLLLLLLLALL
tara:strand:- start:436 stop:675 length:240 start_codon:yes stop_codon:yes gene_type:complete